MHPSLGRLAGTLGVTAVVLLGVVSAVPAHHDRAAERLYLTTDSGVTVVDSLSGETKLSLRDALPTGSWSDVIRARQDRPDATVVEAVDPETGAVLRSQRFDGALSVRAVSRTGDLVALMATEPDRGGGGLYHAAKRARTTLVLTSLDGVPPRTDARAQPALASRHARPGASRRRGRHALRRRTHPGLCPRTEISRAVVHRREDARPHPRRRRRASRHGEGHR